MLLLIPPLLSVLLISVYLANFYADMPGKPGGLTMIPKNFPKFTHKFFPSQQLRNFSSWFTKADLILLKFYIADSQS